MQHAPANARLPQRNSGNGVACSRTALRGASLLLRRRQRNAHSDQRDDAVASGMLVQWRHRSPAVKVMPCRRETLRLEGCAPRCLRESHRAGDQRRGPCRPVQVSATEEAAAVPPPSASQDGPLKLIGVGPRGISASNRLIGGQQHHQRASPAAATQLPLNVPSSRAAASGTISGGEFWAIDDDPKVSSSAAAPGPSAITAPPPLCPVRTCSPPHRAQRPAGPAAAGPPAHLPPPAPPPPPPAATRRRSPAARRPARCWCRAATTATSARCSWRS
jgi:hypothetical protein